MLYFLVLFPYVFSFHSPPVFLSVSLRLSFPRLLCSLLLVPLFSYLLSLSAFWLLSPPQLVLPLFSRLMSHLLCFSLVQCPVVFIQPRCQAFQLGIWRFSASFIVSLQDLSLSFLSFFFCRLVFASVCSQHSLLFVFHLNWTTLCYSTWSSAAHLLHDSMSHWGCSSANLGCKILFEWLLPSYQLKLVWTFPADIWYWQGIFTGERTGAHWIFFSVSGHSL